MATPVEWLGNFQVNTGGAATGGQSDARTIGLANGNILVAWTEAADGAIGLSTGTDIVGQLYDSEGNAIGTAFQINSVRSVDDEGDFDIAAMSDGGWVMAYIDNDISDVNQTSVIWERFNSVGTSIGSAVVADEIVAADFVANPKVAVDLTTGLSYVTYEDDVGAITNISARTVDSVGAVGTEFTIRTADAFTNAPDTAVLSNGNFVTVYEEDDAGTRSIEFRITNTAGTSVSFVTVDAGPAFAPKVASLAGGGFVVVWHEIVGTANSIFFQRYTDAGVAVGVAVNASNNPEEENEADVVALADGGFVVIWDNDTDQTVEGRRFTAGGASDGGTFVTNAVNGFSPSAGLTADGRLLFATNDGGGSGEVFASIWDPRGAVNAADHNTGSRNFLNANVVTGGPGATTINGDGLDVTLLGQGGNDTIIGGLFSQTIRGGSGDDSIAGGDGFVPTSGIGDDIDGGFGNDTIVAAGGGDTIVGGSGADSVEGGDGDDFIDGGFDSDILLGGLGNDTIFAEATLSSIAADSIVGGGGDDSLTGATAFDTMLGGGGLDFISGREGADSLAGGGDNDTLQGAEGKDTLDGGNGSDELFGGVANDVLRGAGDGDTLDGGLGIDFADYTTSAVKVRADLKNPGDNTNDALGDVYFGIENLRGTSDRDKLSGDDGDNLFEGLDENDHLTGRNGADTMVGGAGKDRLKGGGGADQFVLDDFSINDKFNDFLGGTDTIVLLSSLVGLPTGALAASRFVVGNAAQDANDRLIYNKFGNLFFDADGTGAGAQVLIAKLAGAPTLDASDFLVI